MPRADVDTTIFATIKSDLATVSSAARANSELAVGRAQSIIDAIREEVRRRENAYAAALSAYETAKADAPDDEDEAVLAAYEAELAALAAALADAEQALNTARSALFQAEDALENFRSASSSANSQLEQLSTAGAATLAKLAQKLDDYSAFRGLVSPSLLAPATPKNNFLDDLTAEVRDIAAQNSALNSNNADASHKTSNDIFARNCVSLAVAIFQKSHGISRPVSLNRISDNAELIATSQTFGEGKIKDFRDSAHIAKFLSSQPAGTSVMVSFERQNCVGHAFNAAFDGHQVYIINGQTGAVEPWQDSKLLSRFDAQSRPKTWSIYW